MEDRRAGAFQSLSFDARFRLLERDHSPFGLTLSIEPHWGFADETSGVRINHFGVETSAEGRPRGRARPALWRVEPVVRH